VGYQAEREDKKAQNSTDPNERQQAGRHATVDSGGFLQGEEAEGIQDSPDTQKRQNRLESMGYLQPKDEEERGCGDIEAELHPRKQGGVPRFRCVWANDNDKYACQVYRKRFGHKELVEGDIREIDSDTIPDFELLTAGFPCQAFSVAGKRKGFQDTRGTLFFEICRILKAKKPRWFLFENVKGLLSHDKGHTFQVILSSLDELGFNVQWEMLNTKTFLPQNRERIFIFGIRRESR
ncbi:unnamed protein product, partial [marine sediment metagenome]